YDIQWELLEDGQPIQNGQFAAPDVKPEKNGKVDIPLNKPDVQPGAEYYLNVRLVQPKESTWASAGHIVGWEQFQLSYQKSGLSEAASKKLPDLQLTETDNTYTIKGQGFTAVISKKSDALRSYKTSGTEMIEAPLKPNYWRAPTDNDAAWQGMAGLLKEWKDAAQNRTVERISADKVTKGMVSVHIEGRLPVGRSTYQTRYTFVGNGDIKVKSSLSKKGDALTSIPRVGMQLAIPESYNTMNWYGRGPQENYIDRNEGAAIGRYSGTVEELVTPYVRPQENANRTGVRWMSLTNDRGEGLMFIGEQPLSVSAWPYSQQDLAQADHTNEHPAREDVTD